MRLTIKRGVRRYTVLIVGLGAAGVVIGWVGHDLAVLSAVRTVRTVRAARSPGVR